MKHAELYKAVFGEELKKESYKMKDHSFQGKVAGKTYCVKCGLISGKNRFSQWTAERGCLNDLHPSYESQRKKVGADL